MKIPCQTFYQSLIVVLLAVCTLIPAHAAPMQSHAGISLAVKKFVMQQQNSIKNVQVTLTSLNKKLRLPQCGNTLQVSMAPGTKLLGHTSLMVRCNVPQAWKIHVAAHIDGQVNVLVSRHPISRGTVIKNTDLKFRLKRYSQLHHGYYGSADLVQNMEARRNINTEQVLTPNLVKAQKMVQRGQHITIVAQHGALNLRVKGKAMMDGLQGQTIRVKNLNSKKLIYARVVSQGVVRVNY